MIYDRDEWLKPWQEVIDRRHEAIEKLRDGIAVGGSL